ncbi:MAG TPA: DUF167 domain-containing protein [Desulforhopalus sp.]|nr:DUF167 domain-containing protein [Desulforhopalus sp.]
MPYAMTQKDGAVLLRLYVQPKAAKCRLIGLHDGWLKLTVTSPPLDGRANLEVVCFVADFFGLSRMDVTLRSGSHSRKKQVTITGRDEATLRARVAEALADGR